MLEALGPVGLGALYRAEDSSSHVEVDLLLLHPDATARLRTQFSRAAAIKHPNVAGIHAVGETSEGVYYVALEVLHGELLSEILQARRTLPLAEAVELVLQAAAGLQEVHRAGLLHGNLSPEAILVTRADDDRPLVKLVRLGCVQYGAETTGGAADDTRYAAPERLAGQPLDERSDVFSLGAVLHHLLTGAPPGAAPDTSEPVSDAAWAVMSKALDPVPERRFPTVAAFAEALAGVTPRTRAWASTRGAARRARAAAIVAAGLIAAVASLWLMRSAQRSRPDAEPVEAATAGDTRAGPEASDSARSPSAPVDAARAVPPRQSRRQPATAPSRGLPSEHPSPTPQTTVAKPPVTAMPEPAPPESLELDARLREPLPVQLPPIALAPPPDTAAMALPAPRPAAAERTAPAAAAARTSSEAEARAAARRVVAAYARALESKDLRAVEWAYPALTEREREAWKKFFSVARDLVVSLDIERYAIAGSEAKLDVRGTYQYWNRSLHRSDSVPVRFLATLNRTGDGWRLSAIR